MIAAALVAALSALHLYILVLEMFLWTTPRGQKAFGLTPTFAAQSRSLAANMGLYNGFLAAGLLWGVLHPDPAVALQVQLFFVGCVTVAGLFGGLTSSTKILFVQFVPGTVTLAAMLFGI